MTCMVHREDGPAAQLCTQPLLLDGSGLVATPPVGGQGFGWASGGVHLVGEARSHVLTWHATGLLGQWPPPPHSPCQPTTSHPFLLTAQYAQCFPCGKQSTLGDFCLHLIPSSHVYSHLATLPERVVSVGLCSPNSSFSLTHPAPIPFWVCVWDHPSVVPRYQISGCFSSSFPLGLSLVLDVFLQLLPLLFWPCCPCSGTFLPLWWHLF